jgi:hypothetical protein
MSYENTQTTAYIRKEGYNHVTDVRSEGVLIKTVPTPESQIRPERESLLWKKGLPIEDEFDSNERFRLNYRPITA